MTTPEQIKAIRNAGKPERLYPEYQKVSDELLDPDHSKVIDEENGHFKYIRRDSFKHDVVFGCATAAFQVEGAADEGGKGTSIWDHWTHEHADRVDDGSNGDLAVDQYHKYKDDVKLMKSLGLEAYRFSISWPRILPGGTIYAGINREGIEYYSNLINELLEHGIKPYVTLFHWDLPHALEVKYGGFLHKANIVKDFTEYAKLCFREFGDRVENWITFNEPWTYCVYGYAVGSMPPGRGMTKEDYKNSIYSVAKTRGVGSQAICPAGDAGREPYRAAHNMILAHASAVHMYRTCFQAEQGGKIGITNNCHFFEPKNPDSIADKNASIRGLDWMLGWFVAPVITGEYPRTMREAVKDRLPTFTEEEKKMVKGSYDFLGLNYYTTFYAENKPRPAREKPTYMSDKGLVDSQDKNGVYIGEKTGAAWLYVVPRGLYNLLVYVQETYNPKCIYITENGMADADKPGTAISEARKDTLRKIYYREHLGYLKLAIEKGINVKAYFLWSFCDNFEWAQGYESRFGIFYINYNNGLHTRVPKKSALWWNKFFSEKSTKKRKRRSHGNVDDDEERLITNGTPSEGNHVVAEE